MTQLINIWQQESYIKAWEFACHAHNGQKLPGADIPYINHIANVAMEVMAVCSQQPIAEPDLLVQGALLHDSIEDTQVTYSELENHFNITLANGVQALSKDKTLATKALQMKDTLVRIKQQKVEIWMIKLADRITNLQTPPSYWNTEKIKNYHKEAQFILHELHSASDYLATRLETKIINYERHFLPSS